MVISSSTIHTTVLQLLETVAKEIVFQHKQGHWAINGHIKDTNPSCLRCSANVLETGYKGTELQIQSISMVDLTPVFHQSAWSLVCRMNRGTQRESIQSLRWPPSICVRLGDD